MLITVFIQISFSLEFSSNIKETCVIKSLGVRFQLAIGCFQFRPAMTDVSGWMLDVKTQPIGRFVFSFGYVPSETRRKRKAVSLEQETILHW